MKQETFMETLAKGLIKIFLLTMVMILISHFVTGTSNSSYVPIYGHATIICPKEVAGYLSLEETVYPISKTQAGEPAVNISIEPAVNISIPIRILITAGCTVDPIQSKPKPRSIFDPWI